MAKSKNETQNTEDQTTENSSNADIAAPVTPVTPVTSAAPAAPAALVIDAAPAAPAAPAVADTPVTQNENALLSLAALAQTHRVPTWQQAALHRLMDWEDGKLVTDAEYQSALARLSGRRMGGM